MKTIKQLADELGVSKDKVKYQVGKLPSSYLVKVGNITHLTNEGILKIKEILLGKDMGKLLGNYSDKTGEFYPQEEKELYQILKQELQSKNEQIELLQNELKVERTHNREQSDKLADLANQLAEITRNNQILLGAEQSRTNPVLLGDEKERVSDTDETPHRKKGLFGFFRSKK